MTKAILCLLAKIAESPSLTATARMLIVLFSVVGLALAGAIAVLVGPMVRTGLEQMTSINNALVEFRIYVAKAEERNEARTGALNAIGQRLDRQDARLEGLADRVSAMEGRNGMRPH